MPHHETTDDTRPPLIATGIPGLDDVLALVGNMASQIEGLLSRIPPRLDEDLEPGVIRFMTMGQLRAQGFLNEG